MYVSVVYPEETGRMLARRIVDVLSDSERRFLATLDGPRVLDWLAGRIAIKNAVLMQDGLLRAMDIEVSYRASGQPRCPVVDAHCSISHSHGWGLAGISSLSDIGVDIEVMRAHDKALISYVVDDAEYASICKSCPELDITTLVWVVKESVMKAEGHGLIDPHRLRIESVLVDEGGVISMQVRAPSSLFGCPLWSVYAYVIRDAYLGIAIPHDAHETIQFDRCYWSGIRSS